MQQHVLKFIMMLGKVKLKLSQFLEWLYLQLRLRFILQRLMHEKLGIGNIFLIMFQITLKNDVYRI